MRAWFTALKQLRAPQIINYDKIEIPILYTTIFYLFERNG